LGWIGFGFFLGFLAWFFLEKFYFIITAVIIGFCVLAILFIRPYGQSLPVFIGNAISFMFKPKVYIWRKGYQEVSNENKINFKTKEKKEKNKKIGPKEIKSAIEKINIYD
jgi:hypothetical protein